MSIFKFNETELFYEEMGQGVPFLLVHGWAIDHRFLENALEPAFSMLKDNRFRRIYVDVPGMGQSVPGSVKNGDGIIEVLFALMEEIAPGEKYFVGGNSFGAALTRAMIAKVPEKILGGLFMVPASGYAHSIPVRSGVFKKDDEFLSSLPIMERAAFSIMNANLTKKTWERYKRDVLPSVEINRDNEFLRNTLKGSFSFDVDKKLEKRNYEGPVLILTAKYDTAVGYESQFDWLKLFPHASYAVMDGAGHNANVDQPDMFLGIVSGWLNCIVEEYVI